MKNKKLEIEKVLKALDLHTKKDCYSITLCGIYYNSDNNCLVATDGTTLVKFNHIDLPKELKNYLGENFNPVQNTIIYINKKVIKELKQNKQINNHLLFSSNNTVLIKNSDKINYPDYERTIPVPGKFKSLEKYYPNLTLTSMIKFGKTFKLMNFKPYPDYTIIFDEWGTYKQPAIKYATYKESENSQIVFLAMPFRNYKRETAN